MIIQSSPAHPTAPTSVEDAINKIFQPLYSLAGTDKVNHSQYGQLHNVLLANQSQIVLPTGATFAKLGEHEATATAFPWSSFVSVALSLLAGLVPATGPFADLLTILPSILSGLFPTTAS